MRRNNASNRDSSKIWIILCGVLVLAVCGVLAALIFAPKDRPRTGRSTPEVQDERVAKEASSIPAPAPNIDSTDWDARLARHDGRVRRYNRTVLNQQRLGPAYRRSMFEMFSRHRRRFPQIKVRRLGDGCREAIERCPEIADDDLGWKELALLQPLLETGREGDEWDRIVRPESGSELRATVWWEPGHTILLSAYVPVDQRDVPERQVSELAAAFGLREVASRSARWTPEELGKVSAALELLDTAEAPLLRGITLVREKVGSGDKAGLYSYSDGEETITLYDTAFKGDERVFRGSPSSPYPASFFPVLHEVGHLIAHRPETQAGRELNSSIESFNALVERYNRTVKAGNHTSAAQMKSQLEASEAAVDTARARLDSARDLVVRRFMQARAVNAGPTEYGETSPDEAFAESYALYVLDPDAMSRIDPAAARFFADGEHLRGVEGDGG